jgi:hypothetical protein
MDASTLWSAVSAISAATGLAVVIFATIIGLQQLRELVRARHLDAIMRVYDMISSDDARSARRHVYTQLSADPPHTSAGDWRRIEEVCVVFDKVGAMTASQLVPEDELFKSHCLVILRSWVKVEPYVDYRESILDSRYVSHFRDLAARAERYRNRFLPSEHVQFFPEPTT